MSVQAGERVGVVVIHGVGETVEGWTDSFLVPELEKWRAHANIRADPLKKKAKTNELVFVARASDPDPRHIAIALASDSDFWKFAKVTGLDSTPGFHIQIYRTSKLRLQHRDGLVRHIAGVIAKKPAAEWLEDLHQHDIPSAIAFSPASEVHRVRDPESSDPTRTWVSFTRHWPLDDREVILSELFWADMSKVGVTIPTRFSALVQLFLESPYILGRAFLHGSDQGVHGFLRWLIRASNWLMRWPIAGLSVAVFSAAFAVLLLLQQTGRVDWVLPTVAASLAAVAAGGYVIFRQLVHRKLGLADLALSACLHALLLLVGVAVVASLTSTDTLGSPVHYLTIAISLLLLAWALWTGLIALAIVLIAAVAAKRVVVAPREEDPPLARPAAAIALSVLLGMVWKVVLGALGLLVIGALLPELSTKTACPPATWFAGGQFFQECPLAFMKSLLREGTLVNAVAIALVLLGAAIILGVRVAAKKMFEASAKAGTLVLPRLIASPLIVVAIFASALFSAAFYVLFFAFSGNEAYVPTQFLDVLPRGWEVIGTGVLGFLVFGVLLLRFVEMSNAFVHIGRDLVDHQYDPDPNSLAMRLMPDRDSEGKADKGNRKRFRRRARIQRRLEALIDEVTATHEVKRLIFLAHSQGTVILHDYLLDRGGLIGGAHKEKQALKDKVIDVITVGSPLKHIYRYYFREYDHAAARAPGEHPLIDDVRSWTNIWRVDDPIGQDVELVEKLPFKIVNRGIGPGGHTSYWNDDRVCETLWDLIQGPPAPRR